MTNEQLFDDLKQLIVTTVSQQTADLTGRMDGIEAKMATKEDLAVTEQRLAQEIGQVRADVGDALEQVLDALDVTEQLHALDKRVRRLEHKTT